MKLSKFILAVLFMNVFFASVAQAQSFLGAAVSVVEDGSAPFEDHAPIGTHQSGDDIDGTNYIVRTNDSVEFKLEYNTEGDSPVDVTLTAVLSQHAVWDSVFNADILDNFCGSGNWSVSADGMTLTCLAGSLNANVTESINLKATVLSSAPDGDTFMMTYSISSPSSITNPSPGSCAPGGGIAGGCSATTTLVDNPHPISGTRDLLISTKPGMDLRKVDTPRTSVNYDVARQGWYASYDIGLFMADDQDPRGNSPIDETTIGVLSDWITATNSSGAAVPVNATFEQCDNGKYDRMTTPQPPPVPVVDINGHNNVVGSQPGTHVSQYTHPSEATWSCMTAGINQATIQVSDLDFDRITPRYISGQGTSPLRDEYQGLVASAKVVFFLPLADAVNAGGVIRVRNCVGTPVGNDTISQFMPTDLSGVVIPDEDISNNCHDVTFRVNSAGPSGNKVYDPTPPGFDPPNNTLDGSEFFGEVEMFNLGFAPAPNLNAPMLCEKFDNRTQALRGPAVLTTADTVRINYIDDVDFFYGVSSGYGKASGIIYDQTAPTDLTWDKQEVLPCDENAAPVWYRQEDIDFTNTGSGMINAEEINIVRGVGNEPLLPRVSNPVFSTLLNFRVPLIALDNDNGDWLINYGIGSGIVDGTTDRVLASTGGCTGGDGLTCPNPPEVGGGHRPGNTGDAYIHIDGSARIDKEIPSGQLLYVAGDTVTYSLTAVTDLGDSVKIIFPPGEMPPATNVVIQDMLPLNLTYVPGSALISTEDFNGNGILDPGEDINGNGVINTNVNFEPLIDTTPSPAPYDAKSPGGQRLTWSLGDIPFGQTGPSITFDAEISPLTVNNTSHTNDAVILSDSDGSITSCENQNAQISRNELRKCDTVIIRVTSPSAAGVLKEVNKELIDPGEDIVYTLSQANLSGANIEESDLVDLLPWHNDPRGSILNGEISFVSIGGYTGTNPVEYWVSATAQSTLDTLGGSPADGNFEPLLAYGSLNANLGTADWPCQVADVGAGCSITSLADITAVRIVGLDPDPNAVGTGASFLSAGEGPYSVTLTLNTDNLLPGDVLFNSFGGGFDGLQLPVFDPVDNPTRVYNGAVGDLIFLDKDQNGIFDSTVDDPVAGVLVNLLDASGDPLDDPANPGTPYQVTTDGDGRYLFEGLPRGDYIVEIDASNFAVGGALDNTRVSPYAISSDPNDDANENIGHNALGDVTTGVESGVITLGTDEPIGEDVDGILPANILDNEANQTVDFAFEPLGTIGNYLWFDQNGDGLQNEIGTGLEGIRVVLTFPDGSTQEMFTDGNGRYLFVGLPPGDYSVAFDESTLPATGCSLGQCVQSMLALPGQDGGNQQQNYPITLGAGEADLTADFGFWRPITTASSIEHVDVIGNRKSGFTFRFTTSSEISTIGFNVYAVVKQRGKRRSLLTRVNEELIVSTGNINQGASYEVFVPGTGVRGFVIEDVEADGSSLFHDMYKVKRNGEGRSYGLKRHRSKFKNKQRWVQRKLKRQARKELRAFNHRHQQQ